MGPVAELAEHTEQMAGQVIRNISDDLKWWPYELGQFACLYKKKYVSVYVLDVIDASFCEFGRQRIHEFFVLLDREGLHAYFLRGRSERDRQLAMPRSDLNDRFARVEIHRGDDLFGHRGIFQKMLAEIFWHVDIF
jgi:hypothetical protein